MKFWYDFAGKDMWLQLFFFVNAGDQITLFLD